MTDITKQLTALERKLEQLSEVVDDIQKSFKTKRITRRHLTHTKNPVGQQKWLELCQRVHEMFAALSSLKNTVDTVSVTGRGNSPAIATGPDVVGEPQQRTPAQGLPGREQEVPASPEDEDPTTDETMPVTDCDNSPNIAFRSNIGVAQNLPGEEQDSPASPDYEETVTVANDIAEQVTPTCLSSLEDRNIRTREITLQLQQAPDSYERTSIVSTSIEPTHHTTQSSNGSLNSDHVTTPTFSCKYTDIGENLDEAKFVSFSSNSTVRRKGYFKLIVEGLPALNLQESSFHQPGKDHSKSFSSEPDSRGFIKVSAARNGELKFPGFPLPGSRVQEWSQQMQKEFWEETLQGPPRDMIYAIGDPLFPDIGLSPGEGLKRIQGYEHLRGIGTTYIYLSFGLSFSIMHGEDAKFRSMNLLRSGEHKLWLVVEPAYEQELESHIRHEFPEMADCSQAVRHLSCVIRPSKLDEWKVPYSLDYCKPGEAIVTEPGAFHQVLNMGANYAIAINILYGSSPVIPKGYRFCRKSCDPHAITAANLQLRKGRVPALEVQKTAPLAQNKITPTQSNITPAKRKASSTGLRPRAPQITPHMGTLLEAVGGKEAFYHLRSLVRSWRDRSRTLFAVDKGKSPAKQLVEAIDILGERSLLTDFLQRLAKVRLAEIIDSNKQGRLSADVEVITNLIRDLGWVDNKKSRNKLHAYLKEGRKWKRVCGEFDGLLCLIPPNREDNDNPRKTFGRMYQELNDQDLSRFQTLLRSYKLAEPLCRVGKTLQASLWDNAAVPEFRWESEDPEELARLSVEGLTPFIEEFHLITENECHLEEYDWLKPDCWPWEWPQYPTWIPPSDKLCDLCDLCEIEKLCNCIETCLPQITPDITNEGNKGQGVRAIGTTYQKDQILGEFLGELVPLETYHDGWPVEFRRPDLDDEPIAQIYPGERGNWVRKVNHSCVPSAEFRVMKISGWWRQMIIAIEDIPCDGEISASCRRSFLRSQGKQCFCDIHS